tara:strand:- start:255 stop:665 length:411 start_codon:yes stop_codon:yes gene_type:complete
MAVNTEDPRIEFARANQGKSQAEIARHFGVSRQRIKQILDAAGHTHPRFSQKIPRESRSCLQPGCGETFTARPKETRVNCDQHTGQRTRRAAQVQVICDECGKTQMRRASLVRPDQPLTFCDKVCQGRWLGKKTRK